MLDSHCVEFVGDGLGVSVFVKEAVGDDKCLFLTHDVLKLVKRDGQAAFLQINLLRCPEPQHIFSPCRNGLDI